MSAQDFYNILGVSENASKSEIQKAYRKLAKQYHPDKHAGDKAAEEKFKKISEAYTVLNDDKKRKQYDHMRKYGAFTGGNGGTGYDFSQFDLGDVFSNFGSQNQSKRRNNTSGFGGIFDDLFGGQSSSRNQRQSSSSFDVHSDVKVSFNQAISGDKIHIVSPASGKKLQVSIPKGIEDGVKIRLKNQGNSNGRLTGDLLLTIRVERDKNYERKGNDLYYEAPVNIVEATLGSKIRVKTPYDKTVELPIAPGTESGKRFRLKGLGVQTKDVTGDLYVIIKIVPPKKITKRQEELLKEFAKLLS